MNIEISLGDIVEALFDYIMDNNPDVENDWEREDMDVVFTSMRKLPGGGDELRATITCSSDVVKSSEAETAIHDKVPLVREEHDHDLDHD